MISKKKAGLIGLITFFIPIVIVFIGFKFISNQVSLMGDDQRVTKTQNYTALSETTSKGATVFFGDSITELCPLEEIYADYIRDTGIPVINRGISSETTATMLERIEANVVSIQPRNLVMLMGINDLSIDISLKEITQNIQ